MPTITAKIGGQATHGEIVVVRLAGIDMSLVNVKGPHCIKCRYVASHA